jgi:hypothetical protein
LLVVLALTVTCPGEKTQIELTGNEDARQEKPMTPVQPP